MTTHNVPSVECDCMRNLPPDKFHRKDCPSYWPDDSETADSEMYRVLDEQARQKKAQNREQSTLRLQEAGIEFHVYTSGHYLLAGSKAQGFVDFWPATGLYIWRNSKKRGRGVRNLIRELKQ